VPYDQAAPWRGLIRPVSFPLGFVRLESDLAAAAEELIESIRELGRIFFRPVLARMSR